MGEMATLGRHGDVRVMWDPNSPAETMMARKTFDEMVGKGHLAFAVKGDGAKGKQIREFDPDAEKIILAPAMQGG
jgi:hypothetical protein